MSQDTEDSSEVIAYELELPWLPEVFGPRSTMCQRACLPCYGALGGMREKTLTRQGVEDECAALRAQDMINFGGTDLCWRCGKNLLTGKKDSGLRVIQPGEYLDILPPDAQDAEWHLTREAGAIWCPHCRDYSQEPPGVKRYHAELDPDGAAAKRSPGWAEKGWLAWYDCDNCGTQRRQPVSARKVTEWGRQLGGWVVRGGKQE